MNKVSLERLLLLGTVFFAGSPAAAERFVRGDANQDEAVDISDGVAVLQHLFLGGFDITCLDAADTEDSGLIDVSDPIFVFNFLFLGGPSLPAPYPKCGTDITPDELDCALSTCTPCDGTPFQEQGPFGITPTSTAPDFTLPTTAGEWSLRDAWTGCESYIFLIHSRESPYMDSLWDTSVGPLLEASPQNVHYFFLSYDLDPEPPVRDIQGRIEAVLATYPRDRRAFWEAHTHFVLMPPTALQGWIGDVVRNQRYFHFGIDRFQRLRELGILIDPNLGPGELSSLAYAVRHFNFEQKRETSLLPPDEIVTLFDGEEFAGGTREVAVTLPDTATLQSYDTLEIDLTLSCLDSLDKNCTEWDYLAQLHIDRTGDPAMGNDQLAGWVTPYHRPGRWVTDSSALLALIREGGARRFRFSLRQQQKPYLLDLQLRFSNRGKGRRSAVAIPLWAGGPFNEEYNSSHPPMQFEAPESFVRAEIVTILSGHGVGNCAEFCNHTHHFRVNEGAEHIKSHEDAATVLGCAEKVDAGVVPNQYGTWYYGRGGWCPGLDIPPWVADVTADVRPGQRNTVTYRAGIDGNVAIPPPEGTSAHIELSSWLIFYEAGSR